MTKFPFDQGKALPYQSAEVRILALLYHTSSVQGTCFNSNSISLLNFFLILEIWPSSLANNCAMYLFEGALGK